MSQLVRTPEERFQNLPAFPYAPHYVDLNGVRIHYLDEGQGEELILCLHGEPSWSFLYRKMIPSFTQAGYRTIAPDLIGFGRSDKYTDPEAYTFAMHADMLQNFIQALDLHNITAVMQDWGGLLGLNAMRLMPERFQRLVIMNTGLPSGEEPMPEGFQRWKDFSQRLEDLPIGIIVNTGTVTDLPPEVIAAYDAPFPDVSYKAGAKVFPMLVPVTPEQAGAAEMKATRQFLTTWTKPVLVMFSDQDPVTKGGDRWFRKLIPTAAAQPELVITGAGHFLQEDKGEEIAQHIVEFVGRT